MGSKPIGINLAVAQLAEQWTVNPFVGCSNHPSENISVAQWKSAWPITRKPKDRNLAEITGFCGVMVSTLDFESNDPGSNPGKTYI